jgi:hypothetical protein
MGLAVIHALTRGLNARFAILAVVYALVLLSSGLPIIVFALLGLAETFFNFRSRRVNRRSPPAT